MSQEQKKNEIRFKNLPLLLRDMRKKEWIIDSFSFLYKEKPYIVLLTLYKEGEHKPSKYAQAKIEFVKANSINKSIQGYLDFYNVSFNNALKFCDFFGIDGKNANRDLFEDFSCIFSEFIPKEKIISKNATERNLICRRVEGSNPDAIYCYDVRRNGKKEDGTPNKRSIENSNKAQLLCPKLYECYHKETNLSFFFSDNPGDKKSEREIMKIVADRRSN